MIDLGSRLSFSQTIVTTARLVTVNGTGVDLTGFDGAIGEFIAGLWTDGTHTPKLQDSPDNSVWTDVVAANLIGAYTAISGASASALQRVTYIGAQRYLRGVITCSGTTVGMIEGMVIVTGVSRKLPST